LMRWEFRAGPTRHITEELVDLLQRKRLGQLQRAARRIRPRADRGARVPSASDSGQAIPQAEEPSPTERMGRLVQQKRSGAWSPSPPDQD
jgi:hypothetical protein